MKRIRLIHWKEEEARERAASIREAGYEADYHPIRPADLRKLRDDPPDAIIIDLSRLPSQGRDLGMNIRMNKSTRHVPLIFIGGGPEKVRAIRKVLPDAVYTNWGEFQHPLEFAIANPPSNPVTPESIFDVYKGTPLQKKLGFKPDKKLIILGAPDDFEKTLGELPKGVVVRKQARGEADLILWFIKSKKDMEARIERMSAFLRDGYLWIIWPKKASKMETDLSQVIVRKVGLEAGLVDFKICSVDETWSGLCFTRRKES